MSLSAACKLPNSLWREIEDEEKEFKLKYRVRCEKLAPLFMWLEWNSHNNITLRVTKVGFWRLGGGLSWQQQAAAKTHQTCARERRSSSWRRPRQAPAESEKFLIITSPLSLCRNSSARCSLYCKILLNETFN